jgi:hypothetical protein
LIFGALLVTLEAIKGYCVGAHRHARQQNATNYKKGYTRHIWGEKKVFIFIFIILYNIKKNSLILRTHLYFLFFLMRFKAYLREYL